MSSIATRRLIDAAATLDPADRALLNLWVNRGLSDDRLTALTGMSRETLRARRERIVDRLSAQLGLPASDVRAGLTQISPDHEAVGARPNGSAPIRTHGAVAASTNGSAAHPTTETPAGEGPEAAAEAETPEAPAEHTARTVDTEAAAVPDAQEATASAPEDAAAPAPQAAAPVPEAAASGEETVAAPAEGPSPRRRGGMWLGLLAVLVVVIVVVVIVAAGSGSSSAPAAHSSSTTTARAATTATTATAATTTSGAVTPTPTQPAPGPVPDPLAGLPGGLAHVLGSVKLSGPVKHLKLNLRVKGLPTAHNGHYEVWLYNSVLDSRPLGRLRTGRHRLTVRLPDNARRYRWIDISFQPVGATYHSGESELRATNPAHTTKARLRKHAATRRALHRPTAASSATSAGATKTGHGARHHRRAQRRPTAKGSKKSTTSK
jgi:hypothetical protein